MLLANLNILGKTFVSMSEKNNLPYTEAVINEVLRFVSASLIENIFYRKQKLYV